MKSNAVAGAILGCAIGDALGLPYEALPRRRGVRLVGQPDRYRFLFGRGMVSDDTEHTCIVAQALCEHPTDPQAFARAMGRRLRWWLFSIPAGIGLATLRACIKLTLGFSPDTSGVFSAGNGPAMRSAVLGAAIDDLDLLRRFVRASTRITHIDPKAEEGAFAIALAAWCAKQGLHCSHDYFPRLRDTFPLTDEFEDLMAQVESSVLREETTDRFALAIGSDKGVSGYIYRTAPVCLHAWLSHPCDPQSAIDCIIRCGGDTDTTAAIVGGIVGSGVGNAALPPGMLDGLLEWPRSVAWMERLAADITKAMASQTPVRPPELLPLSAPRNLLFLTTVLLHGFRRLLPPY